VLLVLMVAAAGVGLYSTRSAPPGRTVAEPYTERGAVDAALDALNDFAEADYGEAWDRWPAADQKLFGRADYIRLYALCPPLFPGPFLARSDVSVHLLPPAGAEVTLSTQGVAVRRAMTVEAGRWRLHLGEDQRAALSGRNADQVAEVMAADGMCGPGGRPVLLPKRARKTARPVVPSSTRRPSSPRPSTSPSGRPSLARPVAPSPAQAPAVRAPVKVDSSRTAVRSRR
jgi:hypothetical protein